MGKRSGILEGMTLSLILVVTPLTSAAEWGTLKGRFVLDGQPPERPKLVINKDVEYCSKYQPRSEKLIVHPSDRGIANVVIWLDIKPGNRVEIHPSFDAAASAKIRLANKGCRFDPHICVLRTGQTLVIENPDLVDHNTAAGLDRNQPFNEVTPAGKSSERPRFTQPERQPAQLQCAIHPWMTGWLVIKEHPYVAVSDEHGHFEMKHLPVGEHTFVVWHELPGYVQEATRNGQPETWKRGKVTIRVNAADNDFGEVRIAEATLK